MCYNMEPKLIKFKDVWLYQISVHPTDSIEKVHFYFLNRNMAENFLGQYAAHHTYKFWSRLKNSWRGYDCNILYKLAIQIPDYLRLP